MEEQKQEPIKLAEEEQVESKDMITEAKEAADRLERANKLKQELLDREEAIMARQALSGRAEGGQPEPKPVKLSDEEYAEAMTKGEVDPFKEDGF